MNPDWQTWAALGVVALTAAAFLARALRKKKVGGCSTCGGGTQATPQDGKLQKAKYK